nr:MAG TPA: hypothetical protein [Caudoviricetes sp.]
MRRLNKEKSESLHVGGDEQSFSCDCERRWEITKLSV